MWANVLGDLIARINTIIMNNRADGQRHDGLKPVGRLCYIPAIVTMYLLNCVSVRERERGDYSPHTL